MAKRRLYPADPTDKQRVLAESLLPKETRGRKPVHPRCEMLNALLMVRTGRQ